jgi:hypothetical protein
VGACCCCCEPVEGTRGDGGTELRSGAIAFVCPFSISRRVWCGLC